MPMAAGVPVPGIPPELNYPGRGYDYDDIEDEVLSRGLELNRGLAIFAGVGTVAVLGLLYHSRSKDRK